MADPDDEFYSADDRAYSDRVSELIVAAGLTPREPRMSNETFLAEYERRLAIVERNGQRPDRLSQFFTLVNIILASVLAVMVNLVPASPVLSVLFVVAVAVVPNVFTVSAGMGSMAAALGGYDIQTHARIESIEGSSWQRQSWGVC